MNVVLTRKPNAAIGGRIGCRGGGGGNAVAVAVRMTPTSIDMVSATVHATGDDGVLHKFHFRSWWHEYFSDNTRALRWEVRGATGLYRFSDRTSLDQICATGRGAHFLGLHALREFYDDTAAFAKPFRLAAMGLHTALTARFARTVLAALRCNLWRRRMAARTRTRSLARIVLRSAGLCDADNKVASQVACWL